MPKTELSAAYELRTVVIAAAILRGQLDPVHGCSIESAASEALRLLDECRQQMTERKRRADPKPPQKHFEYRQGLEEITGVKKRPGRAEERLERFLVEYEGDIQGILRERTTDFSPLDDLLLASRPMDPKDNLNEGVRRFFEDKERSGFTEAEVKELREKLLSYQSARKKKHPITKKRD